MEYIDVVDENNNLTGKILDRKSIHEQNLKKDSKYLTKQYIKNVKLD